MSTVSAEEKKRLLLERRNKWKQKKAEFDALKVRQETNKESRVESSGTLSKIENGTQKASNRNEDSSKPVGKRASKVKKRAFEESDEEEEPAKVKLFRPDEHPEVNSPLNLDAGTTVVDEDPLDLFMQRLNTDNNDKDRRILDADVLDDALSEEEAVHEIDGVEAEFMRLKKLKSKKRVKRLNTQTQKLEPFVKDFYIEPEEIKNMSETEIDELRLGLDNVKIKGQGCPRPIVKWSQLGLTTDIMDLITKEFAFVSPTPIQAQAIPAIMAGRDVIGISKTGSGKTVSFLLPLLRQIKALRPLTSGETGPMGLILAPTRELAAQIHEETEKFLNPVSKLRSICCTGGSELKQQIKELKKGVEIVVATPGRFIDLLTLNSGKLLNTERVTFVVMDEADRLFDLGFEPQITEIMKTIRPDKQCVLFSATFPTKLKSFASRILDRPISITINSKSLINENIEQQLRIYDNDESKFEGLLDILRKQTQMNSDDERDEKIIVFLSSQQICDLIFYRLQEQNYTTYAIHAGKPYNERASSLEKFKNTKNGILLCTEVLSRGLNVPEVSLVIIYNAVKTFAQYVHTTGRTARGDKHGTAVTLLLSDELAASYILNKSLRDTEIELLDEGTIEKLKAMANKFDSGMKTGKYRLTKGFGGKGLEHMEKLNDEKHNQELKQYNVPEQSKGSEKEDDNHPEADQVIVPKLEYVFLQNKNPNGRITYSAEVNVNDLPQLVRWEATKNTTLSFIKHETACSITNRGRFYPEGSGPKSASDEPKLYLLIEAHEEKDVRLAIELLEDKVKEGVKKVSINEAKSSKFSL
ncbi:Pre-mRNA-processing ATP-dependent RNA helicase PRP5 [Lachancea thermotolerans]